MTIKRPIIGTLYKNQGESLSFCTECIKVGIKEKMQERIYPEGYPSGDAEYWRQCYRCGHLKETRNLKRESRLQTDLVIQQNPFEKSKITAIPNSRIGRKKEKREEDYYNDDYLKKEIREGNQVLGYSES